ncbi:MAG TPA: hypothetical protein VF189_01695 [Patescibacteria group bacterium]
MVDNDYMRKVAEEERRARDRMPLLGPRRALPYAEVGTWGWEFEYRNRPNSTKPDGRTVQREK